MTKTTTPTLAARLGALRVCGQKACQEGVAWARGFSSAAAAWDACGDPQWMLWALKATGRSDDRTLRLFECWCVRHTPLVDGGTTWDLLTDPRSRTAVEVAERFAVGDATAAELRVAEATARAAAWAPGWAPGWAAPGAAAAAGAAAVAVVGAVVGAAAGDAAAAAVGAAAGDAARAAQANALRRLVGANPFLGE